MGSGMEFERDNSNFVSGMGSGAEKVLDFIVSKQPKGMECTCLCGHIKYMIDKIELEDFVKHIEEK